MNELDKYYYDQEEPIKGCLLSLRSYILSYANDVSEAWRYKMPFFNYKNKRFCYLWVHKKYKMPYLGIVDGYAINHPDLIQEERKRMRILLINPTKDLPLNKLNDILSLVFENMKTN